MAVVRPISDPPKSAPVVSGPDPSVSDADLVARIRAGETWAEDALVRRYAPGIMATVVRLLGNQADAEDVTQDTLVTALNKIGELQNPSAVRGWILQIAIRRVHRIFRRQRLLNRFRSEQYGPSYSSLATPAAGPEIHAELGLLDREVSRLGTNERLAWALRRVEGMQMNEVAELCDCSLATAKRRVAAADKRISAHVKIAEIKERS